MAFTVPEGVDGEKFYSLLIVNATAALALLPPEARRQFLLLLKVNETQTPNGLKNLNFTETNISTTTVAFLNQSTSRKHSKYTEDVVLIRLFAFIMIITSLIGVLGNTLVAVVYGKKWKVLNYCQMLILHLAICDIIFSVVQIIQASPSVHASDWPYGYAGCKILGTFILLGSLISVGTMLIIAMERYIGIMKPGKYTRKGVRITASVVFVWLAALISVTPVTIALNYNQQAKDCHEDWPTNGLSDAGKNVYDVFLLILWFLIPLVIISFAYLSIVGLLKKPLQKRGFTNLGENLEVFKKRHSEDLRVVKTLIIVVAIFFVLCLPIRIMWIILNSVDVNHISLTSYFALLYSGLIPYPVHVAVNPFIYSATDRTFRKEAKDVLVFLVPFLRFKARVDPDKLAKAGTLVTGRS